MISVILINGYAPVKQTNKNKQKVIKMSRLESAKEWFLVLVAIIGFVLLVATFVISGFLGDLIFPLLFVIEFFRSGELVWDYIWWTFVSVVIEITSFIVIVIVIAFISED